MIVYSFEPVLSSVVSSPIAANGGNWAAEVPRRGFLFGGLSLLEIGFVVKLFRCVVAVWGLCISDAGCCNELFL